MLVSPLLEGTTRIEIANAIERPYLDMTAGWMEQQGIIFDFDNENYRYFEITGPQKYKAVDSAIPSDWESVAFPLVAAAVTDSEVTIENLDLSGSQGDDQIVDILKQMNARITLNEGNSSLTVKGGSKLKGITIDCSDIPDAVPILAVAGAFAEGTTKLTNVEMVRIKETDRVALMHRELEKMGIEVEETHSTLTIRGGRVKGAAVDSHHDHRIAMAIQVAGLGAEGETTVSDAECVSVSFPSFYEVMNSVGAGIVTEE
jgi:3-phosphoshikimate 1-carboxyvinyltransferase